MLRKGKEDIEIRLRLKLDVSNNPKVFKASAFENHLSSLLDNLYNRPGDKCGRAGAQSLRASWRKRHHVRDEERFTKAYGP